MGHCCSTDMGKQKSNRNCPIVAAYRRLYKPCGRGCILWRDIWAVSSRMRPLWAKIGKAVSQKYLQTEKAAADEMGGSFWENPAISTRRKKY